VAVAILIDALKLIVVLLDSLSAPETEVNEAFRASVSIGIEPPAASRTL
jgi:hypothetical protein